MTLNEKKQAIINRVHKLVNEFNYSSGHQMAMPLIKFSNRMTSTGGTASHRGSETTLKFSIPIMNHPENDFDQYVNQVVCHEVAHLMDFAIHGRFNGHSQTWKMVMMKYCGSDYSETTRCHQFKTNPRKKQARYYVKCDGCGLYLEISTRRVTMMRNGKTYRHSCGGRIDYSCVTKKVENQLVG